MIVRPLRPALVAAALTLVAACSGDPEETPTPTDAVTSATPGVAEAWLDEGHAGWGEQACDACHGEPHQSGYTAAACPLCHGRNGAPDRPAGHADDACSGCHPSSHEGIDSEELEACRACHPLAAGEDGCGVRSEHDVVVIGSGGGGLAAAARLALAGLDVAVLERSYRVGGCMVRFQRGDYNIEASLHAFDGLDPEAGMNRPMLAELDVLDRLRPVRPDPMYRVIYPDSTYDIPSDADEYQDLLVRQFPDEAEGIEALFAELADLDRILKGAMQMQMTGTPPEDLTLDDLTRLQSLSDLTLSEFLDGYIHDQELLAVFTQLVGFAGAQPSRVSALFFIPMWGSYHLGGYYYFEGGSGSVTEALAEVVVENGGSVHFGAEADRIVIDDGRATEVRTTDGRCFGARYVVSNASAPATLLEMVGREHLPEEYVARVEAMEVGLSVFVIYLGVDHDYRDLFQGTHEIMVAESYDQEDSFAAIHDCDPERAGLAVANYSVLDPTAAPEGHNVITITSQLAYECSDEWGWGTSHEAYRQIKESIAEVYLDRAEEIVPDLRSHIEVMEVATPMTVLGYVAAPRGSIFGWDNTVEQSVLNRLEQQTPIPNLFLAGAWTFPGGGQSAVIISGNIAAFTILGLESPPED